MLKRFFSSIAAIVLLASLTSPAHAGDGELLGTLGGAALGGFVGNQFGHGAGRAVGTGVGVFTGAVIGNSFGRSLDRSSGYYGGRYYGYGPSYYAPSYYYEPTYVAPPAPPPPRVVYVQPEIVEYRTRGPAYVEGGYVGAGSAPAPSRYCREFTQQIRIGGKIEESYGTACLRPDGTWRIEK